MKKNIYLCGPDLQLSEGGPLGQTSWRSAVFHFCLKRGIQVINPLTEVKDSLNSNGLSFISGDRSRKEVEKNLSLIDRCDYVLANLYSADESSWIPLIHAHNKGKQVIAWTQFPVNPWLASYTRASFEQIEDALEYIVSQVHDDQKSIIDWSIQYEIGLKEKSEKFPIEGETDFQYFPGTTDNQTLLIAPHATSYWHLGILNEGESYTGALTAALGRLTGVNTIVSSYCSAEDSLYTVGNPLNIKTTTNPLIAFINKLVQVHQLERIVIIRGRNWQNNRGIIVKSYSPDNYSKDCEAKLIEVIKKHSQMRHIDFTFKEVAENSDLARLCNALEKPIIEISIHKACLIPEMQRAQYHNLISMLEETINGF
ncbi:MAG: hypothetical protein QNJ31_02390 [Candidatus Caenarcaniphilales bacterium]|nr:hypothetical protein [Candidatus Caenarcaniphilales bacterium]